MYKKILACLDGSDISKKALSAAIDLAIKYGAQLEAISVEGRLPAYAASIGEIKEAKKEKNRFFSIIGQEAKKIASDKGIDLKTEKRAGDIASVIIGFAKEKGFDLIVLGQKGHSRHFGFIIGSTADKVVDHAPCTVLVVK